MGRMEEHKMREEGRKEGRRNEKKQNVCWILYYHIFNMYLVLTLHLSQIYLQNIMTILWKLSHLIMLLVNITDENYFNISEIFLCFICYYICPFQMYYSHLLINVRCDVQNLLKKLLIEILIHSIFPFNLIQKNLCRTYEVFHFSLTVITFFNFLIFQNALTGDEIVLNILLLALVVLSKKK